MNKKLSIILWVISFVLLLLSSSISIIKPQFIYDSLNVDKLQSDLQLIIDKVDADEQLAVFLNPSYKFSNIDFISDKNNCDYVLINKDSILYWSSNKLAFDKLKTISEPGIYNLSSRIYWVWSRDSLERKIYYLIPLKRNLEFENSFLQNTSFSNLDIPRNYLPTIKKTNLERKF